MSFFSLNRNPEHVRISNPDLTEDQQYYKELQKERDEVETELEISRPLINLVDNLVRMGSLYGGQNELIAQEFYKVGHIFGKLVVKGNQSSSDSFLAERA